MTVLTDAYGRETGYTRKELVKALIDIAIGNSFDAQALETATMLSMTTTRDKFMLDRWIDGSQKGMDHIELQCFALRLSADLEE
ncbi:hypothetical protein [Methyloversatilis sp.]|uniref:hypothetical protein n=1 Tax=Methyloversatilis sp. TaxID=2569862 RepID=UPI0035B17CCA